jgi:hypothetical protein
MAEDDSSVIKNMLHHIQYYHIDDSYVCFLIKLHRAWLVGGSLNKVEKKILLIILIEELNHEIH